jgi:drug/metabolite transporter (DMT)-like permease
MHTMIRFPLVLLFIAVTFCSWGVYGPVLHEGQYAMGEFLKPSSLRPFVCVGIAYFLIAVIVPLILLWQRGEKGHWSPSGIIWSFTAGALGAIGALGIIFAFKSRGSPMFVMPLVFGLAPVVNTFVTMWMTKTLKQANALFLAGVILVAIGAAGVLMFKPSAKHITVDEKDGGPIAISVTSFHGSEEVTKKWTAGNLDELKTSDDLKDAYAFYQKKKRNPNFTQFITIIACIVITAICWGSYGPLLHKGQMRMQGSRMRPFLCVGLAYFVIAVIVPLLAMTGISEPGGWTIVGTSWSLAAGAAGAIGALGIIMAFNYGGKPIMVMPLVFGGAPVVNTMVSIISEGTASQVGAFFYTSLLLVVVGAVIVLIFSPKPGPTPAKQEELPAKQDDEKIKLDLNPNTADAEKSDDA